MPVTRRRLISLGLFAGASALLAACGGQAPPASSSAAPVSPSVAASKPAAQASAAAPATSSKPAAGASAASSAAPAASGLRAIKVVTIGSPSDAGLLLAQKRGYFQVEGMQAEFDTQSGGAQTLPLLATSKIDVAGTAVSAGFFNASNQGVSAKIVADKGQVRDGWRSTNWVVRKDLWDSGKFRDLQNLKGANVAINGPETGAITDLQLSNLLAAAKLQPSDIHLIGLTYPDQPAALQSKNVDVVLMNEPTMSKSIDQGLGVLWPLSPEAGKSRQVAVLMYSPQFITSPEAKRFTVAYLRGVRDFNEAFTKNINKQAVIADLVATGNVKDPKTYETMQLSHVDPNGAVDWDSLGAQIKLDVARGWVKQAPDIASVRDDSLVQSAVQQLGRY